MSTGNPKDKNLYVFWDNSNIWLVGRNVCKKRSPEVDSKSFRIKFSGLLEYVRQGRTIKFAYVCGSVPPVTDDVWKRFQELGVIVEKQERGKESGKEIAVDQAIQGRISNTILDVEPPGVVVLLTGDGNENEMGESFIKSLQRARKHSWEIEVFSWNDGCSKRLLEYARQNGRYQPLDSFYDEITFIQAHRFRLGA